MSTRSTSRCVPRALSLPAAAAPGPQSSTPRPLHGAAGARGQTRSSRGSGEGRTHSPSSDSAAVLRGTMGRLRHLRACRARGIARGSGVRGKRRLLVSTACPPRSALSPAEGHQLVLCKNERRTHRHGTSKVEERSRYLCVSRARVPPSPREGRGCPAEHTQPTEGFPSLHFPPKKTPLAEAPPQPAPPGRLRCQPHAEPRLQPPRRSPATTHLLDFLDVTVIVAGRAGLASLDALVVLQQGGDLRAWGG